MLRRSIACFAIPLLHFSAAKIYIIYIITKFFVNFFSKIAFFFNKIDFLLSLLSFFCLKTCNCHFFFVTLHPKKNKYKLWQIIW